MTIRSADVADECNSDQRFHNRNRRYNFSLTSVDFVEDSMPPGATSWNTLCFPFWRLVYYRELYSAVFRADLH